MGCDILEEWGGRDLPPLRRPWPPQRPRRQGVPRASLRPRRSLGRRRRACARAPRARGAPQRRRGARRRRSRRARVARRARYTRRVSGRSRSPPRARDGAAHSTRGRRRGESDHPNDSDPPLPRWGTADGGGGILEEVLREPSNERTLPAVRGQSDPRELGAQLDDAHLARTQLRRWPLLLLPGSLLLDSPPPACFRALLPVPLPVPLPQECFQEELTLEHESIAWMQKRRNPLMYGGKGGGGLTGGASRMGGLGSP